MPPGKTMRFDDKSVLFDQSEPGAAYASTPFDFSKVDFLKVELVTKFFLHFI